MPTPRITYNSKNLDFPTKGVKVIHQSNPRAALVNQAVSGKVETLNVRANTDVQVVIQNLSNTTHATLKRNVRQWWTWATAGNVWSFASDSGEVVNTTLSSSATKDATNLQLTSVTGVGVKLYVVRQATQNQIVSVNTVNGADVDIDEGIDFAFDSAAVFRSAEFWQGRVRPGAAYPIIEKAPLFWDFVLTFSEDLN